MFKIRKVDATINPALFYVSDLMHAPLQESFYREQLTKAPKNASDLFEIQKVLFTQKFANNRFYFVKFMYYPEKFNKYVTKNALKKLK